MERTKRAESLIRAYKLIEEWCNDNLYGSSYEVFALQKNWGTYMWYDFVWSSQRKELFFARGDHSRWGAHSDSFRTGMSTKTFEYYIFESNGGSKTDYLKVREDGNLVFDEELSRLVNSWPSIKERLLSILRKEDELADFKA